MKLKKRSFIIPEKISTDNYKKNPVVLKNHDYTILPIGKGKILRSNDKGVVVEVTFRKYTDWLLSYFRVFGYVMAWLSHANGEKYLDLLEVSSDTRWYRVNNSHEIKS